MREIKLFNTMNRKNEKLKTIEEGHIKMYVCGPTTYNYIHLGNARPIVVFDTIRRYLEAEGFRVTYIQNFTDIDDKIIKKAAEEGIETGDLAEKYINEYYIDADSLNVKRATFHPKVSENISEIISFVEGLLSKGKAYIVEGDVYFSVRSFSEYGKLSGRSIDDLLSGARIDIDERKKDPLDFALWKSSAAGEPGWKSPWGLGRPGWHIECSAMSRKYLGESFDIHGGGYDLVFPHHENEIAQSESLCNCSMSRYWLHNGFITVNKEKMSKSLGNFFLVREITAKYSPEVVRFYLLSTHYRSPLDFDDEKLEASKKGLERISTCLSALNYAVSEETGREAAEENETIRKEIEKIEEYFYMAMADDFNTALALAKTFDLVKEMNTYLRSKKLSREILEYGQKVLKKQLEIMGIDLQRQKNKNNLPDLLSAVYPELPRVFSGVEEKILESLRKNEIVIEENDFPEFLKSLTDEKAEEFLEALLEARRVSKNVKNFKLADRIRDLLKNNSIILEDSLQGTKWRIES